MFESMGPYINSVKAHLHHHGPPWAEKTAYVERISMRLYRVGTKWMIDADF